MLHSVNKSPFERNTLSGCLRLARKGSTVLLIEDGVYGAVAGTAVSAQVAERMAELSFYALGPDIAARGLGGAALIEGIQIVDYEGFVDLVAEHDVTQAWL
jgi:tRNA 2-thiouridine synthesizing protein B